MGQIEHSATSSASASGSILGALTDVARPEHCFYCFDVLVSLLRHEPTPEPVFEDDGEEYPLFVTWNTLPSRSRLLSSGGNSSPRLRGCIGTFEPYPLAQGLAEYAATSAFKDHRFSPISSKELPRLECGVSFLTAFEDCADYLDWDLGIHGIYIHLPNPALAPPSASSSASPSSSSSSGSPTPASTPVSGTRRSAASARAGPALLTATYLPDVAPAQGWTKEETIDSAIRKAGWAGKVTMEMRRGLRVRRYQSSKIARSWEEYVSWKGEREGEDED